MTSVLRRSARKVLNSADSSSNSTFERRICDEQSRIVALKTFIESFHLEFACYQESQSLKSDKSGGELWGDTTPKTYPEN